MMIYALNAIRFLGKLMVFSEADTRIDLSFDK